MFVWVVLFLFVGSSLAVAPDATKACPCADNKETAPWRIPIPINRNDHVPLPYLQRLGRSGQDSEVTENSNVWFVLPHEPLSAREGANEATLTGHSMRSISTHLASVGATLCVAANGISDTVTLTQDSPRRTQTVSWKYRINEPSGAGLCFENVQPNSHIAAKIPRTAKSKHCNVFLYSVHTSPKRADFHFTLAVLKRLSSSDLSRISTHSKNAIAAAISPHLNMEIGGRQLRVSGTVAASEYRHRKLLFSDTRYSFQAFLTVRDRDTKHKWEVKVVVGSPNIATPHLQAQELHQGYLAAYELFLVLGMLDEEISLI